MPRSLREGKVVNTTTEAILVLAGDDADQRQHSEHQSKVLARQAVVGEDLVDGGVFLLEL